MFGVVHQRSRLPVFHVEELRANNLSSECLSIHRFEIFVGGEIDHCGVGVTIKIVIQPIRNTRTPEVVEGFALPVAILVPISKR